MKASLIGFKDSLEGATARELFERAMATAGEWAPDTLDAFIAGYLHRLDQVENTTLAQNWARYCRLFGRHLSVVGVDRYEYILRDIRRCGFAQIERETNVHSA